MKIKSIENLSYAGSMFQQLASNLSIGGVVSFCVVSFDYQAEKDELLNFSIDQVKELFSANDEIGGSINLSDYSSSKNKIDLYVFCGAMTGDRPTSVDDLREEYRRTAQKNLVLFWDIVKKYFSLPPSRVFEHQPASGSFFDLWVYWGFCYIYINEKTKQGILLSGECSD